LTKRRPPAPACFAAACLLLGGVLAQAQPVLVTNYPDGLLQYESASAFTFTVTSTVGITSVSVQLAATNILQVYSTTNLTVGAGLTVTGPTTNEVVTTPLTSNTMYTATITATDANGVLTDTITFDTVVPGYTWEAEDFDYTTTNASGTFQSGLFFDNPQTNAYAGLAGLENVDAFNLAQGGAAYRPTPQSGDSGILGNELNGDTPRAQYVNANMSDYDSGWNNSGVWGNYTRHYPAGKWNIFARAAGWAAPSENCAMLQGGINGTLLGQFNVPETWQAASTVANPNQAAGGGEYQNYTWVPLSDIAGNPVEWDTDGSQKTLTIQSVNGNYNINYFMLLPINPNYKPVPFVSSPSPNGASNMFSSSSTFSFTANSVPGITSNNIVFTLNGVQPYGLTYSGSPHSLLVTCPIASNTFYTASITLTDVNGSSTFATTFSTFSTNTYTWEAEDWDYSKTNAAGTLVSAQFFDNPQVDAYAGLAGTPMVDCNNSQGGGTAYRSNDTGDLGNEVNGDTKRAQFVTAKGTDYDAGWTSANNWANYTRTYPKGAFYVFMRASSPNSGGQTDAASLAQVTGGLGTTTQTTNFLGKFNVPATGSWQTYAFVPMVDSNGNIVTITNSGAVSTFQVHEDNGGFNFNFLMLVPAGTIPIPPAITQLYPDGSAMFQRTTNLSFVVNSQVPLTSNNVTVTINGAVLHNLIFGGSPTALTVSWPYLQPDTYYNTTISISAPNNVTAAPRTYVFDTFSTNYYTFEAEDFDYNGGQFHDNPQIDLYAHYDGVPGVDATNLSTTGGIAYRGTDDPGDLCNEVTGDVARAQYTAAGMADYDVGWTATGQWGNYTRTYPKGVFNMYMRVASPSGQTDAVSIWQVTSGLGTTNQGLTRLGQFNAPATGGYQNWSWTPLVDSAGNVVTVTTTGAVSTFRMNEDNGGWNANFFMLAPAGFSLSVSLSGTTVKISFPTQSGNSYQIQYKTHLTDPTWTNLGSAVAGTGGILSVQDTLTGGTRYYRGVETP
jgi:hypothetical protein